MKSSATVIKIVSLVVLVALCVAGEWYVGAQNRLIHESRRSLNDPFATPYVLMEPASTSASAPVAILLHGRRCSSSMMIALGRMLARNGVTALIPDMPGHGLSQDGIELSCGSAPPWKFCELPTDQVSIPMLKAFVAQEGLGQRPIVLIGHSWGGVIADTLPKSPEGAALGNIAAIINLEGVIPKPESAVRQLYMASWLYEKFPIEPGAVKQEGLITYYRNEIPHLALINDANINGMILDFVGVERRDTRPLSWFPRMLALGRAGIALLLFSLIPVRKDPPSPERTHGDKMPLLRLVAVIVAGLLLGRVVTSFVIGDNLIFQEQARFSMVHFTYLAVAGAVTLLLLLVTGGARQFGRLVSRQQPIVGALLGATICLLLYLAVANYVENNFFHVSLNTARMPRFALMAALALPIVLVAGYFERVVTRLGFWIVVMVVWAAFSALSGSRDQFEVVEFLFFLSLCEIVGTFAARQAASPMARVVCIALLIGWSTNLYPLIA